MSLEEYITGGKFFGHWQLRLRDDDQEPVAKALFHFFKHNFSQLFSDNETDIYYQ